MLSKKPNWAIPAAITHLLTKKFYFPFSSQPSSFPSSSSSLRQFYGHLLAYTILDTALAAYSIQCGFFFGPPMMWLCVVRKTYFNKIVCHIRIDIKNEKKTAAAKRSKMLSFFFSLPASHATWSLSVASCFLFFVFFFYRFILFACFRFFGY